MMKNPSVPGFKVRLIWLIIFQLSNNGERSMNMTRWAVSLLKFSHVVSPFQPRASFSLVTKPWVLCEHSVFKALVWAQNICLWNSRLEVVSQQAHQVIVHQWSRRPFYRWLKLSGKSSYPLRSLCIRLKWLMRAVISEKVLCNIKTLASKLASQLLTKSLSQCFWQLVAVVDVQ